MLAGLRDIAWVYGNSLDPNAITKVPLSQLKVEFEHIHMVLLEMLAVGLFGMIAEPAELSEIDFIHNNIKN